MRAYMYICNYYADARTRPHARTPASRRSAHVAQPAEPEDAALPDAALPAVSEVM